MAEGVMDNDENEFSADEMETIEKFCFVLAARMTKEQQRQMCRFYTQHVVALLGKCADSSKQGDEVMGNLIADMRSGWEDVRDDVFGASFM